MAVSEVQAMKADLEKTLRGDDRRLLEQVEAMVGMRMALKVCKLEVLYGSAGEIVVADGEELASPSPARGDHVLGLNVLAGRLLGELDSGEHAAQGYHPL